MEFLDPPVSSEQEMLEGMLKSWFAVGKLGGYNSQNMQVGGELCRKPCVPLMQNPPICPYPYGFAWITRTGRSQWRSSVKPTHPLHLS